MIVSNEEDWILGSIKAVSDVVDELVCFVNKSKDDTKFLIERWAAKRWLPRVKVIEGDWDSEEGFAAARNKALAVSDPEADWHLWWDADERLVGAHALHRYLNSPLYPGYIIPQNHLMLDMKAEPDQPVRIFRRDARAKFVGVIHEHPEFEVNQPLEPMLMMGDVQFAHYGYLTERVRREKCVMRNIPLLLKDREKNPERLVGLIFLQRDYIHCAEWHMHSRKALGPEALKFLRGVVEIYHDIFQKLEKNLYRRRWWSHSFSFYQKALMYLGSATESISETVSDQIPFQVASFLSGGYGGMSDESGMSVRPEKRWFCSADEFQAWNTIQADNFSKVMHVRRVGELLEGPDGT
jgi:glycosyltransferase involved in cell wall biosynthesis